VSINTGRVNTGRINRAWIESEEIYITATLSASLNSFITRGTDVYEQQHLGATLGAAAQGARGFLASMQGTATIDSQAELTAHRFVSEEMGASLSQQVLGSLNVHLTGDLSADMAMSSLLGKDMFITETMQAAISALVRPGKNIHSGLLQMNAILDALASTILFAFMDLQIDVDIPPGATLVIDSAGYAVLLDGENVIWAHSGDWPSFSRATYDVAFSMLDGSPIGDGALDKRVLYTERYL